ncbi:MAG: zeta toxin family protein [Candidatus Doudnabacteria bacterium]|nr:zeta toxin family protein [Candidatus Doudnabacteria bacterium]
MLEDDQQLSDSAYQYIKEHKFELVERFANPKIYKPEAQPVSLFMAGSPGAGKTEVSKRLIEVFDGSQPVRIDADDIRAIFPDYNGNNSHIFQRACTLGVNVLFDYVLHNNINAILDGTFAYERAMENIERSLKHNRRVVIYYLFQDPVVAWTFTKIREEKEGRHVSKEVFIHSFVRARENVSQAKAHFGSKIELNLVIKDFSKSFEKLYDNVESLDVYLPKVYTKEALEKLL